MARGLSVYLDLLRLLAALQVAVYHCGRNSAVGLGKSPLWDWGHEAVVIFFVLSGFVIAHAAGSKDATLVRFAAGRFSRLYSVVVPCLVFTVVFDSIGWQLAAKVYESNGIPNVAQSLVARFFLSMLMLNESWVSLKFFSNGPYWSVCYEFWYYVLFAAVFYLTGRFRVTAVAIIVLLSGPQIMLLFPIWLIGVAVYRERLSLAWSRAMVWLAFLQPVPILIIYEFWDLRGKTNQIAIALHQHWGFDLGWASSCLSDYLLGISVALHLVAAKRMEQPLRTLLSRFEPLIRMGAARSFTLYLLHQPLMYLLAALCAAIADGPLPWLIVPGTLFIPMLLAPRIENQRHRLRAPVERVLKHLSPVPAVRAIC
jgi:peptidoglycan/LPS O-acetylase OafA/YrhL